MERYVQAQAMQVSNLGMPISTSEPKESNDAESTFSKELDGSGSPESIGPSHDAGSWPSVVVEVGVSEAILKLEADAAWRLADS
ncbi:hypothetical protein N7478_002683 [Penicillium angulare]|uniref:uncharacterized protein n=1 Tax=Penicillium angulare TaxID=116970 RepID=UPI0025415B1C|nr:uncharacterized protein N7478_002683 [Penicillium angulare]KAJ5286997.1 hypothetical protein N7478_002683 [Penicillium angulare]